MRKSILSSAVCFLVMLRSTNALLVPRTRQHLKRSLSAGPSSFSARIWALFSSGNRDMHGPPNDTHSPLSPRDKKYQQLMKASKLSLAPMMEYTDRHFRHVVRLISNRTLLYTEMVAANAIAHERRSSVEQYQETHGVSHETARQQYNDHYLRRFIAQGVVEPLEGASVLQLGGSDPVQLYEAAETVLELTQRGVCDYTAINLNCGCPSPKVAGKGCFGAALMEEPDLVADLTRAIHDGCQRRFPVSVKCRIGTDSAVPFTKEGYNQLDPEEEYGELCRFIERVAANGVVTDFGVHARIAVLKKSFSPADNRKIPPLKYDVVRRLVHDYPELTFTLNGGVDTLSQAKAELEAAPGLNGIMIGRAWAADPWSFAMTDHILYGEKVPEKNRLQILEEYGRHADAEEARGDPLRIRRFITKAVTPLFAGEPNAKRYRIALDEIARIPKELLSAGTSLEGQPPLSELIVNAALENLSEEVLLRTPEESYEKILYEEEKRKGTPILRPVSIQEWQQQRKEEGSDYLQNSAVVG